MSRFVLASDLDRTLVHSAARLAPGEDAPVVEIYKGRGITVAREETTAALAELAASGAFVPVTTRSREQLARITPVWEAALSGWAICTNGATLLSGGEVDPIWKIEVDRVCGESASLLEAQSAFEGEIGSPESRDWMLMLRDCEQRFFYCTLDLDAIPADLEAQANALLSPLGWHAILHGRKLYSLPVGVCKGKAVAHLRERLEIDELMAAGDSALDIELLLEAEHRWCPIDAELVEMDLVPDHTRLTDAGHVAAGQQIAEDALRWVTGGVVRR
jgi:hydroxymethylpyrimidine pyrophosphatase-like HAD family hydrolase